MIKRLSILPMLLLLCSCSAHKKIPYLQDSNWSQELKEVSFSDLRIKVDDLLSIKVSATNPKSTEPFNLILLPKTSSGNSSIEEKTFGYLVDGSGHIDFPVVGRLKVEGLTTIEASDMVRERLSIYLNETPVVRIRIVNFTVSVLGEVASPGVINIDSERINIFEALAMAGDMTLYGERRGVKIVREMPNGRRRVVSLDLQSADIIDSEYYYLQQNDVIYVQPNRPKANTSAITTSSTIWISFTSALMSIASFILAFAL